MRIKILIGQTASGKKEIALHLAQHLNAEIISVDSMKIYRGMDIGTAKPGISERRQTRFHLIDIIEPSENYNVAKFVQSCDEAISEVVSRKKEPLLVVGTPMYLKALLYGIFSDLGSDSNVRNELEKVINEKGLGHLHNKLKAIDPLKAAKIHPNDKKRIIRALEVYAISGQPISSLQIHFTKEKLRYDTVMVGLRWKSEDLYQRIDERVERMFSAGLVDEVKRLTGSGKGLSPQAQQAVGYKEVIQYLNNELILAQAKEQIKNNTHHLARRQMTWFRRLPEVHWIECSSKTSRADILNAVLEAFPTGSAQA